MPVIVVPSGTGPGPGPEPPPITGSGTGQGPSLALLVQRLAAQLGFWASSVVTTAAVGAEPSRVVLADDWRDDEIGQELIAGRWLYVRSGAQAGLQRRIVQQPDVGYQGPIGAVVLSRPLEAPLAPGDLVTLTSPLPVKRHLGQKGLVDLINEALARCWIPAWLEQSGNGTDRYDLSSFPDLDLGDPQLAGLAEAESGTSAIGQRRSSARARIVANGPGRTLVTDTVYGSTRQFRVDVIIRADRLAWDGTSWVYRSRPVDPGLWADQEQTACPESWVITFAMVKALQELEKLVQMRQGVDPSERARAVADIRSRRATWAAAAASIKRLEMPRSLGPRTAPITWAETA